MKAQLFRTQTCLILLLIPGARIPRPAAQESVAQLQERFDQESNSGQKAKLLIRLGQAEFVASRQAGEKGDYSTVDVLMEKYRDNVQVAFQALKKEHPNDSNFGAYRSMEIHLRKSLRELQETIITVPPEYVPPLQLVRKDLEEVQDQLLRQLFPKRPGEKSPSPPQKKPSSP